MNADGGAAFPRIESIQTPQSVNWERPQYSKVESAGGMSLRDYFAAKALPALIAFAAQADGVDATKRAMALVVTSAYSIADEMLKARGGAT